MGSTAAHRACWATLLAAVLNVITIDSFQPLNQASIPSRLFNSGSETRTGADERTQAKDAVLSILSSTPSNVPTPKRDTEEILKRIRYLEAYCPTEDGSVLQELKGNWELIWTAQDSSSEEWKRGPLVTWINPLENQSYANNPNSSSESGRANPFLPKPIQDRLEKLGLLKGMDNVRSTQSIDLKKLQVRNVVSFLLPSFGKSRKATLVVLVDFKPNSVDKRKVDVKFQSCRVLVTDFTDFTIPLDIIGPTGWLKTTYIDESIRITRGHKGSVFVLLRTASQ